MTPTLLIYFVKLSSDFNILKNGVNDIKENKKRKVGNSKKRKKK